MAPSLNLPGFSKTASLQEKLSSINENYEAENTRAKFLQPMPVISSVTPEDQKKKKLFSNAKTNTELLSKDFALLLK